MDDCGTVKARLPCARDRARTLHPGDTRACGGGSSAPRHHMQSCSQDNHDYIGFEWMLIETRLTLAADFAGTATFDPPHPPQENLKCFWSVLLNVDFNSPPLECDFSL